MKNYAYCLLRRVSRGYVSTNSIHILRGTPLKGDIDVIIKCQRNFVTFEGREVTGIHPALMALININIDTKHNGHIVGVMLESHVMTDLG